MCLKCFHFATSSLREMFNWSNSLEGSITQISQTEFADEKSGFRVLRGSSCPLSAVTVEL